MGERENHLPFAFSHILMLFPPCLPALVGSGQKFLPLCLQGGGGGTSLPLAIALTVLQELSGGVGWGGGKPQENSFLEDTKGSPCHSAPSSAAPGSPTLSLDLNSLPSQQEELKPSFLLAFLPICLFCESIHS